MSAVRRVARAHAEDHVRTGLARVMSIPAIERLVSSKICITAAFVFAGPLEKFSGLRISF